MSHKIIEHKTYLSYNYHVFKQGVAYELQRV